MWYLNDDDATPRFPRILKPQPGPCKAAAPLLKPGCWIVQLVPKFDDDDNPDLAVDPPIPTWALRYLGPLRVEVVKYPKGEEPESCLRASGDLYADRHPWSQPSMQDPQPHLDRKYPRIPVFPRADYSFYYTVESLTCKAKDPTAKAKDPTEQREHQLEIRLASFAFDAQKLTWGPATNLTVVVEPPKPKSGDQRPTGPWDGSFQPFLTGDVTNDDGTPVGSVELRWISNYLREAQIGIEVAPGLKLPLASQRGVEVKPGSQLAKLLPGAALLANQAAATFEPPRASAGNCTVQSIFEAIGWRITFARPVISSIKADVWQDLDLTTEMLKLRATADYDRQWIYHALVVPRFTTQQYLFFGKMYTGVGVDTDLVPREGLVVAAKAQFTEDAQFGSAAGKALQDVPAAAFCNFMHELGHTMGLLHRYRGNGFMQELLYFALVDTAPGERKFPENLGFHYDPKDVLRLRHHPDIWVRPGGVPFATGFSEMPVPDNDVLTDVSAQMQLVVKPVAPVVPLGAPVKLQLRLTNRTQGTLPGPVDMSLKAGSVAGSVVAPSGEVGTFSAVAPFDYVHVANFAAGRSLCHGESIWRGPGGALFPAPGFYRIDVEVGWVAPGGLARSRAHCKVLISPPLTREHEQAAYRILACPDLVYLLINRAAPGGAGAPVSERLIMAMDLLQECLAVAELRPFLAPLEALLVASTDLRQSARLLDAQSVLTTGEVDYLVAQIKQAGKPAAPDGAVRGMIAFLRQRVGQALSGGQIDESERWRLLGSIQEVERLHGPAEEAP